MFNGVLSQPQMIMEYLNAPIFREKKYKQITHRYLGWNLKGKRTLTECNSPTLSLVWHKLKIEAEKKKVSSILQTLPKSYIVLRSICPTHNQAEKSWILNNILKISFPWGACTIGFRWDDSKDGRKVMACLATVAHRIHSRVVEDKRVDVLGSCLHHQHHALGKRPVGQRVGRQQNPGAVGMPSRRDYSWVKPHLIKKDDKLARFCWKPFKGSGVAWWKDLITLQVKKHTFRKLKKRCIPHICFVHPLHRIFEHRSFSEACRSFEDQSFPLPEGITFSWFLCTYFEAERWNVCVTFLHACHLVVFIQQYKIRDSLWFKRERKHKLDSMDERVHVGSGFGQIQTSIIENLDNRKWTLNF